MAEAAFDTIAEVQRLRDAGFEQAQAEAITRSIHSGVTGGVATKADVLLLKADIQQVRSEIGHAKTELEGKINTQGETLRKEIAGVGKDVDLVRKDVDLVRKDVEALDAKLDTSVAALDKKIDTSVTTLKKDMTILLGSIMVGGIVVITLLDRMLGG